jgi:hypothetical protein
MRASPDAAPELAPARLQRAMRRGARRPALWVFLLLFAVYAAGAGLPSVPGSDLRPSEAHVLLTTQSVVEDGSVELSDDYVDRSWSTFYDGELEPTALRVNGRLIEPQGLAFPVLLAPAYAVGGKLGVQLFLALIAALGFTLAAALGRRLVPDPWATGAALAVGLSPPAVLAATTIAPAATCATLLAGAALMALRVRDAPQGGPAIAGALLLAPVIWLSPAAALPAAVVAVALFRWLRRRRRAWTGFAALEIVLISVVVFVTVNGRLFGGPTPYAASVADDAPTGAGDLGDYAARLPRLLTLWLGPETGILLTAPFLVLAFVSVWMLWRSRRERLSRAFPGEVDVEVAAGFLGAIGAAAVLTAIVLQPSLGSRFAGEALVVALPCAAALSSWALRRHDRLGLALALVGFTLTGWILLAGHLAGDAGLAPAAGPLPWSVF